MKSKELPMPVVLGVVGIILLVVVAVAYMSFMKPPPQVDAAKIPPTRLSDPDPGRGSQKTDVYHR